MRPGFEPTYKELKQIIPTCLPFYHPLFRAYLQGIETNKQESWKLIKTVFRAYLQGIETKEFYIVANTKNQFRAYLQGIETQVYWTVAIYI